MDAAPTIACTASAPCVTLNPEQVDHFTGMLWALGVVVLFALGFIGGRAR